ncbi:DUF2515 domain-containing protein [Bacillus sp. FJAT-42376]|uniref:DUF2515 family protein n=1 Tax=Bacillus sp. FJAT-42376 TaxID=2014076 RepID=UPI000F5087AB|nr:DUF2515 family protein [Bacillus sp. FJAT-42376]AZB43206.1 DUF2515 domain-containing protein [Bacillus sp. FJAT-42376]
MAKKKWGRSGYSLPAEEMDALYASLFKQLSKDPEPVVTDGEERTIIEEISRHIKHANRSNLTRTASYLLFHSRNPEIHWALLAHLVSRNGGYSMTDLKSSYIGPLLGKQEQADLFHLLEWINASIFADAYPQLLLYEESKKRGRNLFHLLPRFRVSCFMEPVWSAFFENGSRSFLTGALIANEQSMIEKNILSTSQASHVMNNLKFTLQEKWGLTRILFPYKTRQKQKRYSVAGLTVMQFQSLHERILTGKKLYCILYSHQTIHDSILAFCKSSVHTASRSDYWPHLFSPVESPVKLNSPSLEDSWPLVPAPPPAKSDWFKSFGMPKGFEKPETAKVQDLSNKVMADLFKLAPISAISKKLLH